MYLHNILNRDNQELFRRTSEIQKGNATTGDFIELVKEDMSKIGEAKNEDYISHERNSFKAQIQRKMISAAFKELTLKQKEHSKVREIQYPEFNIQPYMTSCSFSNKMVSTIYKQQALSNS